MILAAAAAVMGAQTADLPVIRSRRTVGETCVVSADDARGRFDVIVSWAPCQEVKLRITSIGELADSGELGQLDCRDLHALATTNRGRVISAWGEFAATIYIRDGAEVREVTIAD